MHLFVFDMQHVKREPAKIFYRSWTSYFESPDNDFRF